MIFSPKVMPHMIAVTQKVLREIVSRFLCPERYPHQVQLPPACMIGTLVAFAVTLRTTVSIRQWGCAPGFT